MSKNSTYPALRMSMGSWDYYSVRMSLKEVSNKLIMASNFKEATVLDDMLGSETKLNIMYSSSYKAIHGYIYIL